MIVAGFELIGEGLADLFGFGGSHTDLSNDAWTPTTTWSVTGWGIFSGRCHLVSNRWSDMG